ncbi:MAG TPA: 2,3-bisphosphoglycerate-independent phosphoglycerate mutase [archaeon]|nr:2,3-bisphosphoglycerate-independent phosphoglycerate mutase [archaeon]
MSLKLERLKKISSRRGPLLLVIMDGVGIGRQDETNGVYLANTPNLDRLWATDKLYTQLKAHGPAVGLPDEGDMGNSEVGHNALGAGRVFAQGAKRVNAAIDSGEIYETELWEKIAARGKQGGAVHFIGLLSDGNVHSHIKHLFSMVNRCAVEGIRRLRVHALADGRDVGERSALDYIVPTEELLARISSEKKYDYRIASGGGRMKVTMDRYEADWTIVERGWNAHVRGIGRPFSSASEAVRTYYDEDPGMTDQYLDSFVVVDKKGRPVGRITDGDVVIFFNFRGDRAIEISKAFTQEDFDKFDRGRLPDIIYAGMMQYDSDINMPPLYLVLPPRIDRTMSEYLVTDNVTMFAISETQKFGHVTYFWNGNRSGYIDKKLESYIEIPSDNIHFDKAPKMKAREITDKTVEFLEGGHYRFGRINFPNGDMVGHTGVMEAVIVAVETVDQCVGRLIEVVNKLGGITVITADHGNSDDMFSIKNGKKIVKTAHSLNPVPFWIVDSGYGGEYEMADIETPGLSNVAATLLNLLGYEKPEDYDQSLISFV